MQSRRLVVSGFLAMACVGWGVHAEVASSQVKRAARVAPRLASAKLPAQQQRPIPIVTVDGAVQGGTDVQLSIFAVASKQGNLRVKLTRAHGGDSVALNVRSWSASRVVAAVPVAPFGEPARYEEVLVGLCDAKGSWIGAPIRTVFTPSRANRVGKRPRGCATPDWDGDGVNARECGGSDCDDGDGRRYPGAIEVCDRDDLDEDCDATTFGSRDADRDGAVDAACCNRDSDGVKLCGNDCDDHRPGVHRTATEACDQADNDCDGYVDEGVQLVLWSDRDGDGFGDAASPVAACGWREGLSYVNNDCNDADARVHKGHGCE